MVGDDVIEDIEGAANYGLDSVLINRKGKTYDNISGKTKFYEISSLGVLPEIILNG
ncbi:HAD hydrolase [Sporanaerobacter sp. PP17-6a]|jgi:ribonucleotide monophosphatase NagD (HAD superfamily)|nr:HAD hydrolase [Sporanaerobacter sp. PP17-6a]